MYQNQYHAWNRQAPYGPTYTGVFERTVKVGERERRFLIYLPENVRCSAAGVFVLPENGKTADDVLQESLWKQIADTEIALEKMIVVVLEPEDGVWNTEEVYGCLDGDVAYINAVLAYWGGIDLACIHQSKFYLMGCGEGGTIAHMAAMWNPANFAGLASIGGAAVPESYIETAKNASCEDLHFISVPQLGIQKGQVAVPTWIIHDSETPCGISVAVEEYWKNACLVAPEPRQIDPETVEFIRTKELHPLQECDKEAYCVRISSIAGVAKNHGYRMLFRVWHDFLKCHRRWVGNPCGDLQMTKDPVRDLGMEYHYEDINGCMREWYVHVPRQVKEHPERAVPLVFAMHGLQCSGAIYAGDSGWYRVADLHEFIVVFPSAASGLLDIPGIGFGREDQARMPAWNFLGTEDRPDELAFFKELIERVSADHKIDRSRIYATGHSHGSMMTHTLGMALTEIFAAIAPCSGVMFKLGNEIAIPELPAVLGRVDQELPCWMFGGDSEEWLLPAVPASDNITGKAIAMWREINHIEPSVPENWENNWTINGRWHNLEYRSPDSDTVVRYTWVEQLPHAVICEQSRLIWEEFFSKYQRVNGKISLIEEETR